MSPRISATFPVRTARRRTVPVLVVLALGLVTSVSASLWARSREYANLTRDFALDRENGISSIRREIESDLAALRSVAGYSEIDSPLRAENFEGFAGQVRRVYPTILAFEWIPSLLLQEKNGASALISAPPGPESLSLRFRSPRTEYVVIGFDAASGLQNRGVMNPARDTGQPIGTSGVQLIHGSKTGYGVPVYLAVYNGGSGELTPEQRRERISGFVMEIIDIPSVVTRALNVFGPKRIDFSLFDLSAPADKRLLYAYRSPFDLEPRAALSEQVNPSEGNFHSISRFEVAGRQWAIVAAATPNYLSMAQSWQPFGILVVGLAGTIGIVAYLLLNAAYNFRADRLVGQLYSINAHLNEQVEERVKAESEVSRLNENLESRVLERTEQLRLVNEQLVLAQEEAERVHKEELRHLLSKQQAEEALRESEQRYALAALGSKDGLWDWNLTTDQVYYSPRWKQMLGYTDSQIGSSPDEWLSRIHVTDVARVKAEVEAHRAGITTHFQTEYRIRHSDGAYRWMLSRGVAVFGTRGTPARMAGSQTDITEGKIADPLTGLSSRLFLLDKLEMAIGRMCEQPNALFAVLFLDLDRFKVINDSLGHLAGDRLLINIAHRLQTCAASSNLDASQVTTARLGGDEFAVLLDRIAAPEQASLFADQINLAMKGPFMLEGHQVFVSSSIGLALGSPFITAEDILRNADTAMYQAKAHGGERYEIFDSGMRTKAVERLQLETELRHAIENEALEIHFQPKIALDTGRIVEFEALVRWRHPSRGMIKPDEFIPVAEETGLIIPLGSWVLAQACRQLAIWHEVHPASEHVGVSVNLSTRQFAQRNLVDHIASTLQQAGLPPKCLSLELTESVLMHSAESAIVILNALRGMQIGLKIDDFGTGFSSLNYLHRLPFDELKIDRSFIVGLANQHESQQIVRTVVLLARSLRMSVVAEGVEQSSQLEQLSALGCDYAQGDLLSPPLTASDAERFLQSNLSAPPAHLSGPSNNELFAL